MSDLNSGILSLNMNTQKLGNTKIEVQLLACISRLKTIACCFLQVLPPFVHRTQISSGVELSIHGDKNFL